MSFEVIINGQKFDVHDRFKNIIASVAVGELLSLYDEHTPGQKITVESFTTSVNDKFEVQQYVFKGRSTDTDNKDICNRPVDVGDEARLFGMVPSMTKVSDALAFHYAHLPPKSIVILNNIEYRLQTRHTNIITYQAPLGSGLFSQLYFSKV